MADEPGRIEPRRQKSTSTWAWAMCYAGPSSPCSAYTVLQPCPCLLIGVTVLRQGVRKSADIVPDCPHSWVVPQQALLSGAAATDLASRLLTLWANSKWLLPAGPAGSQGWWEWPADSGWRVAQRHPLHLLGHNSQGLGGAGGQVWVLLRNVAPL